MVETITALPIHMMTLPPLPDASGRVMCIDCDRLFVPGPRSGERTRSVNRGDHIECWVYGHVCPYCLRMPSALPMDPQ